LVLSLLALSNAHLCLLYPPQIGLNTTNLNFASTDECVNSNVIAPNANYPCKATTPVYQFPANSQIEMIAQKNLKHQGGNAITFFMIAGTQQTILAQFTGNVEDTLSLFYAKVTLPGPQNNIFLGASYDTASDGNNLAYFQCVSVDLI